jgi:pimeloyl-ACP methyl ester carboxylesterase
VSLGASSRRSPAPAIALSIVAGGLLALAVAYLVAPDGSEGLVTGSLLLAFGAGWALMAWLTTRFSAQPQRWLYLPAAALAGVGAALALLQPSPGVMDLLGWIWPLALMVLVVWMFLQLRRQLHGFGRVLVGALTVALLLIAIAGGLITVTTAAAPAAGAGRLIDVGGRSLYLECSGTGSPAVILQAGAGGSSTAWSTIAPEVAKNTTVCSYDRAGRGRSGDPPAPQDGEAIARDLHDLLAKSGVPGPYVFVGHSSGGPYLRVYAAAYPADVAGMVLIDPQPATAFTALPNYPGIYEYLKLSGGLAPSLARIGLLGPLFGVGPTEASSDVAVSYRDEIRMLPKALEEAAKVTSIGDVPLIIVSAGIESQQGWSAAQDAQASLSTNVAHRTIAGSTHDTLLESDSGASVEAMLDVLDAIRSGTTVH